MRVIDYVLLFIIAFIFILVLSIAPTIIHGDMDSEEEPSFVIAWICASVIGALFVIVVAYFKGRAI